MTLTFGLYDGTVVRETQVGEGGGLACSFIVSVNRIQCSISPSRKVHMLMQLRQKNFWLKCTAVIRNLSGWIFWVTDGLIEYWSLLVLQSITIKSSPVQNS